MSDEEFDKLKTQLAYEKGRVAGLIELVKTMESHIKILEIIAGTKF